MILSGIAKPYSVALFNAAIKADIAEQVDGDIASFARLLEENDNFRTFLGSPQVLTEDKKDLIHKVIGERTSGLFVKFVMLLIDKKRIQFMREMGRAYNQLFERHRGVLEVRAITAIDMDHDMQTMTRRTIESKTGKKVRLVAQTDPRIIGGMILIIDNKIIDGSIRFQLDTISKSLGELKVH